MNLWLTAVIVLGSTAAGVGLFMLHRRHAPEGGYFSDGDRAAGVFGVLTTGFVLVHQLSEEECLEAFDVAQVGFEYLLKRLRQDLNETDAYAKALEALDKKKQGREKDSEKTGKQNA